MSLVPSAPSPSSSKGADSAAARSDGRYEITRDGLIVFFGTAKDISEATELLAPLKVACGLMVRALETAKVCSA